MHEHQRRSSSVNPNRDPSPVPRRNRTRFGESSSPTVRSQADSTAFAARLRALPATPTTLSRRLILLEMHPASTESERATGTERQRQCRQLGPPSIASGDNAGAWPRPPASLVLANSAGTASLFPLGLQAGAGRSSNRASDCCSRPEGAMRTPWRQFPRQHQGSYAHMYITALSPPRSWVSTTSTNRVFWRLDRPICSPCLSRQRRQRRRRRHASHSEPPERRTTPRRLTCGGTYSWARVVPPRPSLTLQEDRACSPAAPLMFDRAIGQSVVSISPAYGVTFARCDSDRRVHVNDSNRQCPRVVDTKGGLKAVYVQPPVMVSGAIAGPRFR